MKLTSKQIKIIIRNTPKGLKGTTPYLVDILGYYQPSNANWCYEAGYTEGGILVVTFFGSVV